MQRSNAGACLRSLCPQHRLEGLLFASELALTFLWYLEALLQEPSVSCQSVWLSIRAAHLGGVQNGLYLLKQAALVLLERRIRLHSLLDQELNIP